MAEYDQRQVVNVCWLVQVRAHRGIRWKRSSKLTNAQLRGPVITTFCFATTSLARVKALAIAMVRFLGVNLPENRRLWYALTKVYGIGRSRAEALCYQIGATPLTRASELRPFHVSQLTAAVEDQYVVGAELRNTVRANIQRLIDIRCYRGVRHMQGLPVRGQRTHSNAKTRKRQRSSPRTQ